jgi:hypothetical protein
MALNDNAGAHEAKHGEKMIEIKIRLWTNDLSAEKGKVLRRHAWTSGTVTMEANKSHGISPSGSEPFHSLLDLGSAVEKALIQHGIVLHSSRRMRKYLKGAKSSGTAAGRD